MSYQVIMNVDTVFIMVYHVLYHIISCVIQLLKKKKKNREKKERKKSELCRCILLSVIFTDEI